MAMERKAGDARIDVHAKADKDFNSDIIDSVDGLGDEMEDSGDSSGKRFGEGFNSGFGERLNNVRSNLGRGFSERMERIGVTGGDSAGASAGARLSERLRSVLSRSDASKGLDDAFSDSMADDIGDRFGEAMTEAIVERVEDGFSAMLDDMEQRLDTVSRNSGGGRRGGGGGTTSGGDRAFPSRDPDDRLWIEAHEANKRFDQARGRMLTLAASMNEKFDHRRMSDLMKAYALNEAFDAKRMAMLNLAYRLNEVHDQKRGAMIERAMAMNDAFDRARGKMLDQAYKMNERFNNDRDKMLFQAYRMDQQFNVSREKMLDLAYRMNVKFNRDRAAQLQRDGRENESMRDRALAMNRRFDMARLKAIREEIGRTRSFDRERYRLMREGYAIQRKYDMRRTLPGDGRNSRGGFVGRDSSSRDTGSSGPSLGDRLGGLTGRGSRSNVLNMLGSSVRGVTNMITGLTNIVPKFVSTFRGGMAQAAEGAGLLARVGKGAGAVLGRMGAAGASAGPAIAAGLIILVPIIILLTNLVAGLVAVITVMASTIVSALVGALAVAGAAMIAVVAAGGLLTAAFMSMNDAQKKALSTSFSPLRDQMNDIGQIMITKMVPYFNVWANNISAGMRLLTPIARVMGDAFGIAGKRLTDSFSGPGFQAMSNALATYLPGIVKKLATAFGNFLNGLMGMFSVIMPYVRRFASYLVDVTEKFANWANSAKGRDEIRDFVDRAVESLQSLWRFTKRFFGWLGEILFDSQAQTSGNTLFDDLSDAFEKFRGAIRDGSLEDWFKSAIKFGRSMGKVMDGLGDIIEALVDAGVIDQLADGLEWVGEAMEAIAPIAKPLVKVLKVALPVAIRIIMGPLGSLADAAWKVYDAFKAMKDMISDAKNAQGTVIDAGPLAKNGGTGSPASQYAGRGTGSPASSYAANRVSRNSMYGAAQRVASDSPMTSRASTYAKTPPSNNRYGGPSGRELGIGQGAGAGYERSMGGSSDGWKNPYAKWAQQFIEEGPGTFARVNQAIREIRKMSRQAVRDAATAEGAGAAKDALTQAMTDMRQRAKDMVADARDAVSQAAQNLADASSPAEAQRAMRVLNRQRQQLRRALRKQDKADDAASALGDQRSVDRERVALLVEGYKISNATLAEYAAARQKIVRKLEDARGALEAAVQMRSDFRDQIAQSIRDYGGLATATGQMIDGVEQALTSDDIIGNLEGRLKSITKFQEDLRKLLALGLSDEAYRQIVESGVEQGGALADALMQGGVGAIDQINHLIGDIGTAGDALGDAASSRMYDAGVEAARGLVEGLKAQEDALDKAARRLGDRIANGIRRSLGIKSPARRTMGDMDYVGDGAALGLDAQGNKVERAAQRLANKINITPTMRRNRYAPDDDGPGKPGEGGAGGSSTTHHWHISTPTEDPKAVAREMINEMTGRLP